MRITALVVGAALFFLTGCNDSIIVHKDPTPTSIVLANTELLTDALDHFAAENGGDYPWSPSSTTPAGHTLIDLLPDGQMLLNPYTGERTEPRWCFDDDVSPGTIQYRPEPDDLGHGYPYPIPGYRLTGYAAGADDDTVTVLDLTIGPDSLFTRAGHAVENAWMVRDAAEAFAARNNGEYPAITTSENLDGDCLIDVLPAGSMLLNPYSYLNDSPVDGVGLHGAGGLHAHKQWFMVLRLPDPPAEPMQ